VACSAALVVVVAGPEQVAVAGYLTVVVVVGIAVAVGAGGVAFLVPVLIPPLAKWSVASGETAVYAVTCSSLPLLACIILARPIQLLFLLAFVYGIALLAGLLMALMLTGFSSPPCSLALLKRAIHEIVTQGRHKAFTENDIRQELDSINEAGGHLPVSSILVREALSEMVVETDEAESMLDVQGGKYIPRWSLEYMELVRQALPAVIVFGGTHSTPDAESISESLRDDLCRDSGLSAELLEARGLADVLRRELRSYEECDSESIGSHEERSILDVRTNTVLFSRNLIRGQARHAQEAQGVPARIRELAELIPVMKELTCDVNYDGSVEGLLVCLLESAIYEEKDLFCRYLDDVSGPRCERRILDILADQQDAVSASQLAEVLAKEDNLLPTIISWFPHLRYELGRHLEAGVLKSLDRLEREALVTRDVEHSHYRDFGLTVWRGVDATNGDRST
jgi:hypothetical protein